MKKSKLIFSLLIAMIILVAMSVKSSAVTLSTSETPSTVNSGSEFSIVLKFDEKITAVNAHILYDKDLVTMSASNSQGIAIEPEYSEGDLALIYSTFNATDNTFKITAKAANVTEEKVAEFKVTDLQLTTETSEESLNSQTFKVTIKPTVSPVDTPVDTTVTNKKQLAKTGERSIILLIIGAIAIVAVVTGIKTKKTKLFVMLPLLVAVTIAGKTAEAKTVGVASDKTTTGILSEMPDLNGIKAIGVSANDTFLANDADVHEKDKLTKTDLKKFFDENDIENPTITSEDGKTTRNDTDRLATGDIIKSGSTEYKLVIFGDANGDGMICNSLDIRIIVHDYLGNAEEENVKKAEGITKIAANIFVEEKNENRYRLNVFDINRMKLKYIAKESGNPIIGDTLIKNESDESIFTDDGKDDSAPVITPSGNITLVVEETENLSADKDVTWSSSDSSIVKVDSNGTITGIKEGTATITATDSNGKTATVTITVKDGVAQVGSEVYKTVQEAIDSIKTNSQTTVKLLKDVRDTELREGTSAFKVSSSQNVILDLNGHSLVGYKKFENDSNGYEIIGALLNNGTLEIKNGSSTKAKISTSDANMGSGVRNIITTGNLTIGENILIENYMECIDINAQNSKPVVTINGAEIYVKSSYNTPVVNIYDGPGVFTMNSGTIKNENGRGVWTAGTDIGATINILGGTINAKNEAVGSCDIVNIGKSGENPANGPVLKSEVGGSVIKGPINTLNFYQGVMYGNASTHDEVQLIDNTIETIKTPTGMKISTSAVNETIDGIAYEFRARLEMNNL